MSNSTFRSAMDLVRRTERDLFDSEGRIFTRTRGAFNESTGTHTDSESNKYVGDLRVRPLGSQARQVEAGGQSITLHAYSVKCPETVSGVAVDDRVEITASADPHLVGKEFRVADEPGDEWVIHRKLVCVEEGRDGA